VSYGDDAMQQLSTIGHKAREAEQAFATTAIEMFGPDEPPSDVNSSRSGSVP
jgi:hypothetical protein